MLPCGILPSICIENVNYYLGQVFGSMGTKFAPERLQELNEWLNP
jgi:hypothetical protein